MGQKGRWFLRGLQDEKDTSIMLPTTILIDENPRCVVRPTDRKALNRFLRNGKVYLLADSPDGMISHRAATEPELARWNDAFALHRAGGGDEEEFFGVPL